MKNNRTLKILALIAAVAVILAGGAGITGAAAQSSIPGDTLYSVKTTIENTQLALAKDAGDRAQMKLFFAERRLAEIGGLIQDGRYREIREAVLAFEANINAAVMELATVSASDPARAAAITQEVTAALTRYAGMLSELAAAAPDSVRPEVNRALDTTQIASGLSQPSGNENANANDNSSFDDGNTNANENGDDNSNANENGDDNGNDAVDNSNANENGDDNGNDAVDNSNDNGSDDNGNDAVDNSNGNGIDDSGNDDNGNAAVDNGNDNGDDNSNQAVDNSNQAVDNSNDNGSDDHGGSGGNSNDDSSGRGGSDDNGDDDSSGRGGGDDD